MPLYTFECPACGAQSDEFRTVAARNDAPQCCSGAMERRVSAPMVISDMQPYQSMVDGTMITSRSQHRAHLKQHGCVEIGNDTGYFKGKDKIDVSPESKKARKQAIIDRVNALK